MEKLNFDDLNKCEIDILTEKIDEIVDWINENENPIPFSKVLNDIADVQAKDRRTAIEEDYDDEVTIVDLTGIFRR